ncbi:hypothetical protein EXIGLDRAFT_732542 [Exidia glandulosa HHB12029]|uniref:Uncharacterized protein n=1 Tax=Exidia glandulosa HHB12029 TaxID=1314781 RepID=A0A165KRF8_EXIGL|nr:hypothetical protein EXIGLDRAFT_732542 [Exidia glandulosa HHB12029]
MRLNYLHIVALALPGAVVALPTVVDHLPRLTSIPAHASHVAYDIERRVILAFDAAGSPLAEVDVNSGAFVSADKRDSVSVCTNISAAGVQSLPGFQTLHDIAVANWGDGWSELLTNVNDPGLQPQNNMNADACVTGPTQITLDGDPNCQTSAQTADAQFIGASGSVTLQYIEGTTSATEITVTSESATQIGDTISVGFSIPEVVDVSEELTFSETITNSHSTATTTTHDDQTSQTMTLNGLPGQTCSLDFNVQTCGIIGHGNVQMAARGWLWIYYPHKRNGHAWWGLSIDGNIPDASQRSTYIQVSTSTSSTSHSDYKATCVGGNA